MIVFPTAKINLGLNVVAKRSDGYHDIETVFMAIPLEDALEIKKMDPKFPSNTPCDLKITGNAIQGQEQDNLVVRAYNLLSKDFELPRVHIHLYKNIPSEAGLGGGSADAAFTIRLLDERFRLNMGIAEMERYAAMLGADCPFFITSETVFAEGIGDRFSPIIGLNERLEDKWLVIVKPDVSISTRDAYAQIVPKHGIQTCRDIVMKDISMWKNSLTNDFEKPAFAQFPILAQIKEKFYEMGAEYAQMSGSGSAMFAFFDKEPANIKQIFGNDLKLCKQL